MTLFLLVFNYKAYNQTSYFKNYCLITIVKRLNLRLDLVFTGNSQNKQKIMKTYSKKSAFSLIELSIVLIIIGLLVAGITGGASLIKSATLRAVMTEARNYNTAVNSFYVAYNAYPGDYGTDFASGIATGFKGDNDGKIEFSSNTSGTDTRQKYEGYGAIAMLSYSKMITNEISSTAYPSTNFSASTAPAGVPGTTIPQSKVKGSGWIFDYFSNDLPRVGNSDSWTDTTYGDSQNVVILTSSVPVNNITSLQKSTTKGSLSPEDAKSVDLKLDDGMPNSGKVRTFGLNGETTPKDCVKALGSSGAYNDTGLKTADCVLTYAVDVTS